jgi:lycopene cyclase domain-containing protein
VKYTYLFINFFSVFVPFLFSFHPKLKFYKHFQSFFKANVLVGIFYILWDILFTQMGVWGFNPDYVTGIYFINLPLEEILFFVCIPFSCVFTYHSLLLFLKIKWQPKTEKIVVITMITLFMIVGMCFYTKAYTVFAFIGLALLLYVLKFRFKITWLPQFLMTYLVLLLPFFIVNGLLTGTGLASPIVWYNNAENMEIRLLTIPLEDVFYGFGLLFLNVFFFEIFKKNEINDSPIYHHR